MNDISTIITVASDSRLQNVASAIARMVREGRRVTVQAFGATAGERAMKATAVAWCSLRAEGIDVACSPCFAAIKSDSQDHTAVSLRVLRR